MQEGQAISRPALNTKTSIGGTIGTPVFAGQESYATPPDLKAMKPIGNGVNGVIYHDGVTETIATKSADMTNSTTNLNITASEENRGAKNAYPNRKQDTGIMYTGQQ